MQQPQYTRNVADSLANARGGGFSSDAVLDLLQTGMCYFSFPIYHLPHASVPGAAMQRHFHLPGTTSLLACSQACLGSRSRSQLLHTSNSMHVTSLLSSHCVPASQHTCIVTVHRAFTSVPRTPSQLRGKQRQTADRWVAAVGRAFIGWCSG